MRITHLLVAATACVSTAAISAETLVEQAQKQLATMGYKPGPANGVENKKTQEAVKRFQKSQKLDASGHLDTQTLAALNIQPTMSLARNAPPRESSSSPSSESSSSPSSESRKSPSSEASSSTPSSESSSQSSSEKMTQPAGEQPRS